MSRIFALVALLWATAGAAAECADRDYQGVSYTVCTAQPARDTLRLFLADPEGIPFGGFASVEQSLQGSGEKLGFAMNAGMFHRDFSPVGHYVESGVQKMRVIAGAGPGNFGLVPNGVFCIRPGRADVIETEAFLRTNPNCDYATQSGPMLVIDGALHPRFLADGTSRFIRNGVGTTADGSRAHFVISKSRVNFYDFASFFRDVLNVPQALYFDGNVSRLYAPNLDRSDPGRRLGPIVGTVVSSK